MSDSLQSHELQHARLPCPSLSPRVSSNSCPSSRWYHSTISSSVTLFSCCLQSFSASGSFPVSQRFASGGQTIGASALASILPVNIQGWFPLGLTGLISLLSKGLSRAFSNTTSEKHQFFGAQLVLGIQHNDSVTHTYIFLFRLFFCRLLQNIECRCLCYIVSPTLSDPTDCSPPGFSVHGVLQAKILEWVAILFSRGIFLTQGSTQVLCLLHCR